MTTGGVLAIVLTFDAPRELERCLKAIDAQVPAPERILVVDNDSPAPVAGLVNSLQLRTPVETLRSSSNTGPAGGHAAGLQFFSESSFDRAWVMDDDCEPTPGALERLIDDAVRADPDVDPIYPTWMNTALGRATDYPAWSGFLIRRSTVLEVGVPRADFFWWMEDTEYLHWRMRTAGYRPHRVADAVVLHHQDRRTAPKPAWKYYYEVRNSMYFRLRIQRGQGRRFYRLGRALGGATVNAAKGPERLLKFKMIALGVIDGARGSLGAKSSLPPLAGRAHG